MKRSFTLSAVLLLSIVTFAQSSSLNSRLLPSKNCKKSMVSYHKGGLSPELKSIKASYRLDNAIVNSEGTDVAKLDYLYDESNRSTSYVSYYADETGNWETSWKEEYEYDTNNRIAAYEEYEFDAQWYKYSRTEYTYDTENKIETELYYTPTNDVWILRYKNEYFYTAAAEIDYVNAYSYSAGVYTLSDKIEYNYNESGTLNNTLESSYYSEEWHPTYKVEYIYDENDLMTVATSLDYSGDTWVNSYKEEFVRDEYGNISEYIDFEWDADLGWLEDYKEIFTHDNTAVYDDLTLPFAYERDASLFFTHKLNTATDYYFIDNDWYEIAVITFNYFSGTPTGTTEKVETKIELYPNPVVNELTISTGGANSARLELYDITGNKVKEIQVKQGLKVNVEDLTPGIYIYNLVTNNGTTKCGKLMKK
ncbi:T9SS type A sorting domain-containing protein [Carboxylicivirga caseinilyticus]|uniref:T9SS type A sorting domain-containing protein n=1 Tax=Carboxylicivirga caseinilyticus TaxID=3417572 RepID=UPI003D354100|nr:T9SS type A sorting domain-containing protein [Marinilabiliaceae bacterium A049]